jgi:D-glycero-D-manno-heptose 1,7-bisphosphate phosphatase
MRKAVFLDRDGVINRLVFNPATGAYESPHTAAGLDIFPSAAESLRKLTGAGYLLFLVSNQPSYAKGKTSMENIQTVHKKLELYLKANEVEFTEYYYCYHHPDGVIPEYTCECHCRKPSPFFLKNAARKYLLDMTLSWMVGDQDFDIFCGQRGGVKTILVNEKHSANKRGKSFPDYIARNLEEAAQIILNYKPHAKKEEGKKK